MNETGKVEPISAPKPTVISDELHRLIEVLREVCPQEAVIGFEYDNRLRLHIDVRTIEDVTRIEALLPSICGGVFYDIQRGLAAHHSFFHRISALVAL